LKIAESKSLCLPRSDFNQSQDNSFMED